MAQLLFNARRGINGAEGAAFGAFYLNRPGWQSPWLVTPIVGGQCAACCQTSNASASGQTCQ